MLELTDRRRWVAGGGGAVAWGFVGGVGTPGTCDKMLSRNLFVHQRRADCRLYRLNLAPIVLS